MDFCLQSSGTLNECPTEFKMSSLNVLVMSSWLRISLKQKMHFFVAMKKKKNRQNYGHCKVFSAFNIPLIFERWQHLRKDLLVL